VIVIAGSERSFARAGEAARTGLPRGKRPLQGSMTAKPEPPNDEGARAAVPRWTLPPLFPDRRHWLYMLGLGGRKGRATIRRRGLLDPRLSDEAFATRVTQWARGRATQQRGRERREEAAEAVRQSVSARPR